ncbi:TPA: YncE family protein [Stenotrophomonas maltophilia]|uniref:YncE family protein n=1 Tax=Stenotrophomonas TaxID=40323 RepID=UPI0013DBFE7E|nr:MULTISPECIES: YncE family protein [Stenotrophomonas]MBH1591275.1 YncE family protein [Stenotrophomonas maltophilia]MDH2023841.1 YncE family protein [Stenotrophomonas sp. GD03680]HEL3750910.1 YncE family protein [Stenotrophomonas maltophilia]HEL7731135.1 YncE family protein [Stenotrophomonas maltophilia]
MFRHSAFRSAALALAISLSVGAPAAFADNAPAASTATAVQRQAIAKGLYELAYSPAQNAVFVASSGGFGDDAGPSQVLRLNPATLAVETRIPLERKAFGVVLDDAHNRLYVGNTVDTSVTVVDTAQNNAIGIVQLMEKKVGKDGKAAYTHDLRELVVDSPANRLYVTGHSSEGSVLFVVDTTTLKVIDTIPGLGNAKAPGLALDAANKRVYTSNLLADLVVVGTDDNKVVAQHKISAEQPMNIALHPDGKRLFVTDQGSEMIRSYMTKSSAGFTSKHPGQRVLVLDRTTGKELASIPTDAGPLGILLDAPRKRLYVTNRDGGTVTAYDSDSYQKVASYPVPTHPNSLALDAKNNVLYVSIKNGEKDAKDANESVARIQL